MVLTLIEGWRGGEGSEEEALAVRGTKARLQHKLLAGQDIRAKNNGAWRRHNKLKCAVSRAGRVRGFVNRH